jgi:hypothetical protein
MSLISEITTPPGKVPNPADQDEVTVIPLKIEDWLTVIVMGLLALITFANVLATSPASRLHGPKSSRCF